MSRRRRNRPGHASAVRVDRPPDTRSPRVRSSDPRPDRSGRTPLLLVLGALVVGIAAVAAVALTASDGDGPAASPRRTTTLTPTVSGRSLTPFVAPEGDPSVGMPIPEVAGASFDGSSVAISADGRPKILLFLAHWCPHCQREVPVVQGWLDAGGLPSGIDLISIATSIDAGRPNYPPEAWLASEGWVPPVLVDPENVVADAYGLGSFPYWVAVAADGTVTLRLSGELSVEQLNALAAAVSG